MGAKKESLSYRDVCLIFSILYLSSCWLEGNSMFIHTLLTKTCITPQKDTDIALPAYMLPTIAAVAVTGITLGVWLYRRLKPIFYSALPLQFFNPVYAHPDMVSAIFRQYPVFERVVHYVDLPGDALSLSQVNRLAYQARFLNPQLQNLHFKSMKQVDRFLIYCREVELAEQMVASEVLLRRLGDLAPIRTLSLTFSCDFSGRQSLDLFRYLPGLTSLKIEYIEDKEFVPDDLACLGLLFKALPSPLALRHLTLSLSWFLTPAGRQVSLPAGLWQLTSLETLRLQNFVDMDTLPKEIGKLQALKTLEITNMRSLRSLPGTIQKLEKLETLKLGGLDRLRTLPQWIGGLQALTSLTLTSLPLTSLPDSLTELKRLVHLELSYFDHLGALPEQIGRLGALRYLRLTSLFSLTHLPQSLWALENLQELALGMIPQLREIPESVCGLTALTSLSIGNMGIHRLPESLWQLPHLQKLELYSMSDLSEITASQ